MTPSFLCDLLLSKQRATFRAWLTIRYRTLPQIGDEHRAPAVVDLLAQQIQRVVVVVLLAHVRAERCVEKLHVLSDLHHAFFEQR